MVAWTRLNAPIGIIDLDEWLYNLETIPELKAMIEKGVDPDTGKIKNYRSLEEQLAKVQGQIAALEERAAAGEDVASDLEAKRTQAAKCQKAIEERAGVIEERLAA